MMTERSRPGARSIPGRCAAAVKAVLPALLALGFATPYLARADDEDALARVHSRNLLRVAVYRNFAPFHEDDKGGIDDDIGLELAHRLGVHVSVQSYMPGDEMGDDFRNAIWKGHYMGLPVSDVMLHVPVEQALAEDSPQVEIFGAYAREETVVAYDGEQMSDWKGMESLGSLRCGVETESMADMYLASFGGSYRSQIEHFRDLAEAVAAMKEGHVQAVIGSRTKIEAALGEARSRYPSARFNAGVYGKALELGVAVKKGETRLREQLASALAAMRGDGSLQRIYLKHGASWQEPQ